MFGVDLYIPPFSLNTPPTMSRTTFPKDFPAVDVAGKNIYLSPAFHEPHQPSQISLSFSIHPRTGLAVVKRSAFRFKNLHYIKQYCNVLFGKRLLAIKQFIQKLYLLVGTDNNCLTSGTAKSENIDAAQDIHVPITNPLYICSHALMSDFSGDNLISEHGGNIKGLAKCQILVPRVITTTNPIPYVPWVVRSSDQAEFQTDKRVVYLGCRTRSQTPCSSYSVNGHRFTRRAVVEHKRCIVPLEERFVDVLCLGLLRKQEKKKKQKDKSVHRRNTFNKDC